MMQLYRSPVIFNELDHTYTLNGRTLSGITSLLSRTLFPSKYDGISPEVLAKAAAFGSNIHEQCEMVDSCGVESSDPLVMAYIKMKEQWGLHSLATEYLVSDEQYIASSIDSVYEDLSLGDYKTTSRLDREYLSWQLSAYAYLFERQNPGLYARRLLGIWLPKPRYGTPAIVTVPRRSSMEIEDLIATDILNQF